MAHSSTKRNTRHTLRYSSPQYLRYPTVCRLRQLQVSTCVWYVPVGYGVLIWAVTATLTHTFLYSRKQIWQQSRRAISEQPDIHARLMAKYPQVPEWWYAIIFCEFVSSVSVGIPHILSSVDVRLRYHRSGGLAYRHASLGFRLGLGTL